MLVALPTRTSLITRKYKEILWFNKITYNFKKLFRLNKITSSVYNSYTKLIFDKILLHLQSFLRNTLELSYSVYVIVYHGFEFIQF